MLLDCITLQWPTIPKYVNFTYDFPMSFYYEINDYIKIKKGRNYYICRNGKVYKNILITNKSYNCSISIKDIYHSYNDYVENNNKKSFIIILNKLKDNLSIII